MRPIETVSASFPRLTNRQQPCIKPIAARPLHCVELEHHVLCHIGTGGGRRRLDSYLFPGCLCAREIISLVRAASCEFNFDRLWYLSVIEQPQQVERCRDPPIEGYLTITEAHGSVI